MIFYRFTGDKELRLFLWGEMVRCSRNNGISCNDFLFFDDSKPIESRIAYMVGKADLSNVAEFEVLNPGRFAKNVGVYQNPMTYDSNVLRKMGIAELFYLTAKKDSPTVMVNEYHARMYCDKDLRLLRIGTPGMFAGVSSGEYMVVWKGVNEWKRSKERCLR